VVYDERATVLGQDEIGDLTTTFNRMLDRLQASDVELRSSNAGLNREIANRQRLEGQLLESSRLAGMAQVATGVLHNVGNVLNSVNVSANILRDTLSTDPNFALLGQTTRLLTQQGSNLAQFLSEDPRGKLVPPFFIMLGEQIALVNQNLVHETEQLSKNIDHIKQIVALQQNFAQGGGVVMGVDPLDLFSDALRIAHASISRHGITVTRDFGTVSEILTDRHQVLQILVNFITNGVQALKPRPVESRVLKLGLRQKDEAVEFSVEDTGIGIAPENISRIFQHGFTTRKDGHGFGLHSGALAARNLKGKLLVHSDGLDQGSRFSLVVPLTTKKALAPA
jgi:signal transduction histidine kinase